MLTEQINEDWSVRSDNYNRYVERGICHRASGKVAGAD